MDYPDHRIKENSRKAEKYVGHLSAPRTKTYVLKLFSFVLRPDTQNALKSETRVTSSSGPGTTLERMAHP